MPEESLLEIFADDIHGPMSARQVPPGWYLLGETLVLLDMATFVCLVGRLWNICTIQFVIGMVHCKLVSWKQTMVTK